MATSAGVQPAGVALDGSGDLYFTDGADGSVRLLPVASPFGSGQTMSAGDLYTVAGGGGTGGPASGGAATSASLAEPRGVAVDGAGNLYVADTAANEVRFVPATSGSFFGQTMTAGDLYTIAGDGTAGSSGSGGPAVQAALDDPTGVAVDSAGNLYVADTGASEVLFVPATSGSYFGQTMTAGDLYPIAGDGTAGSSGTGGPATGAELDHPQAVAVDSDGNLVIADTAANEVRFVPAASGSFFGQTMIGGDLYTIAGNGTAASSGTGGPAVQAALDDPTGVAVDGSGVAIADSANNLVRFVPATSGSFFGQTMTAGDLYTIAGNGTAGVSSSGAASGVTGRQSTLAPAVGANGSTATTGGPHVTSITDDSSPLGGGAPVTINGYGFTGATSVSFGSTPVTLSAGDVASDTQINVNAPAALAAGPIEVTVTTPAGTSTHNPGDVFTYLTGPVLLGADGSVNVNGPPSPVTLYGYGLWGTSSLDVGTTSVATSPSTDHFLSITPPSSSSVGTVPVTVPGAASSPVSVPITYDTTPQVDDVQLVPPANTVTSVFAPEGPLAGGQTFQLSGSGFAGATKVLFGTTPASSFTVASDGSISGTVPASNVAGPVDVTVVGPNGTSAINGNDIWYYDPGGTIGVGAAGANPPAITTVDGYPIGVGDYSFGDPVDGPAGPAKGSTVTLTGTNFTGVTAVDFGDTPSPSVTVTSDTQLTAAVPTSLSTTAAITVTNASGTSVLTPGANFTPTTSPIVTSVTTTGSTATIRGFGLTGARAVDFAGEAASNVKVVNDNLVTATPPSGVTEGDVTVTTSAGGTSPINPMDVFGYYSPSVPLLNNQIPALFGGSLSFFLYGELAPSFTSGDSTDFGLGVGVPGGGDPVTECAVGPTPAGLDFGAAAATDVSVSTDGSSSSGCYPDSSSQTITATSPAGAPGPAPMTLTGGTASSPLLPGAFWYYGPSGAATTPVVTGIGASTVALSNSSFEGYAPVVPVFGSGFESTTGTTAVTVGGVSVPTADISVVNDDLMFLTLPAGTPTSATTPDAVIVTTSNGTSASTADDLVTVTPGTGAAAPAPPTGADAAASDVSNTTTGTASASVGPLSATATGEGGVTVASYAGDPTTTVPSGSTGTYLDVAVSTHDSFTSLDVKVCRLTSNEALDYYDGAAWVPMAPQSFDPSTGCATAVLNNTSSTPLISDLTGTPVAVVSVSATTGTGGTTGGTTGGGGTGSTGSTGGGGSPVVAGGGGGGTFGGAVGISVGTGTGGSAPTSPVVTPTTPPTATPAPKPAPKPLPPVASLETAASKILRGEVGVKLTCANTACGGTLELVHGHDTLGKRSYRLAPGKSGTFLVRLDRLGMRLLSQAKNGRLLVSERASVDGGVSLEQKLVLIAPARPKVTLAVTHLVVRGAGVMRVSLQCAAKTCQGILRLAQGKVGFAARSFKIAAGRTTVLVVRLDHAAQLRLRQARGHRIVAVESVKVFGGATVRRIVRLLG